MSKSIFEKTVFNLTLLDYRDVLCAFAAALEPPDSGYLCFKPGRNAKRQCRQYGAALQSDMVSNWNKGWLRVLLKWRSFHSA